MLAAALNSTSQQVRFGYVDSVPAAIAVPVAVSDTALNHRVLDKKIDLIMVCSYIVQGQGAESTTQEVVPLASTARL
jgi:hypothetical protein